MAIQDLATNYGLLPDYIEMPPSVGLQFPSQPPRISATRSLATAQSAPAGAEPPVDTETDAQSRRVAREAPRSLAAMDQRYAGSTYAPELRAAATTVKQEQAAFDALVKQSLEQPSEKPSQAELYFRLAAAFGTPTKTGSFVESLGVVGSRPWRLPMTIR